MAGRLCALCLALLLAAALCAQDRGEEASSPGAAGYYLEDEGGGLRFVQRLTWQADSYAWRYEVVVEEERNGSFRELVREFTQDPFIEVSLPPGRYRYAIRAHDLLDRPGEMGEWLPFEILLALEPGIGSFFPAAFYLDEDTIWEIALSGENLSPQAEVYLRHPGSRRSTIVPLRYSSSSSMGNARLVFGGRYLTPGTYEIHIKNPGGLEDSAGPFTIGYRKPLDLYLSAGYAPLIPLYGELNKLFSQPLFPVGTIFRAGLIPLKRPFGYMGVELNAGWSWLFASPGDYKVSIHAVGAGIDALYQWWFPNKIMALVFRAGGGINMALDYHFEYARGKTAPLNLLIPQAEAGLSFLWLIRKPFFMESGLDYIHWFTKDASPPGYLRFWVGAGRQF